MKPPDVELFKKVRQWLEYADEDLKVARHSFSISEPPYRLIAYHCQQCAEKYLKAYLVFHLVDFPYTHNMGPLLDLCSQHGSWVREIRQVEILSAYAMTARYPGETDVMEADAQHAIKIAEQVRQTIRNVLSEEGFNLAKQS